MGFFDTLKGMFGGAKQTTTNKANTAQNNTKEDGVWDTVKDKTEEFADKAEDMADKAWDKTKEVAHDLKEKAGEMIEDLDTKTQPMQDKVADAFEDAKETGKSIINKAKDALDRNNTPKADNETE